MVASWQVPRNLELPAPGKREQIWARAGGTSKMVWMITDKSALRGTLYVEILPGPYLDNCWGPNSVFFTEGNFSFFEPTIIRHWPAHDHYSFSNIPAQVWLGIQQDFGAMSTIVERGGRLAELTDFIYPQRSRIRPADESILVSELRSAIDEFNGWLTTILADHDIIAVLGV